MTVCAYYNVLKQRSKEFSAAEICEIQCLNVEDNCSVVGTSASDKWDLAETLVCLQGPFSLDTACNGHVVDKFFCMCKCMRNE